MIDTYVAIHSLRPGNDESRGTVLIRFSRSGGIKPVSGEASLRRIKALKGPTGQPQHALRIFSNPGDFLLRCTARPSLPGAEAARCGIITAVEAISGSCPKRSLMIYQ